MRRLPWYLPILVLAAACSGCVKNAAPGDARRTSLTEDSILLRNVRIFDVSVGEMSDPQDILIDQGHILAVGEHGDAAAAHQQIDCSGKYAVPGLFDCHAHLVMLTDEGEDKLTAELRAFVANGVTQVRDVGGPIDVLSAMSHEIASGNMVGPEMFYTGPMLEASPLTWEHHNEEHPGFTVAIDTIEDVDRVLPDLARQGACMVKTFNKFDQDVYRHLVDVARRHSLRIVHDPGMPLFQWMPMDVALDMGVTSIEHAKAPWPIVLTEELQQEHDQLLGPDANETAQRMFMMRVAPLGMEAISQDRLRSLIARTREQGACLCPTLAVFPTMEENAIAQIKKTHQIDEIPEPMLELIKSGIAAMEQVSRAFVREFAAGGVRMLVGQDGCDPAGTFVEMRMMNECGVTEAEIIKGATIYPAQWLGVDDRLGAISPGKQANILVVDGNPLEDINHMSATFLVIQHGRVLTEGTAVESSVSP